MSSSHLSSQPPPQFQIWHDAPPQNNAFTTMMKPRPQLQPSAMPLQPITNPTNHPEAVLSPPMSAPPQPSPLKTTSLPSPPKPNYNKLDLIHIPPPIEDAFTDSPVKKFHAEPPLLSSRPVCPPMPFQRPMFTTFNSNLEAFEPEPYRRPSTGTENFVEFPEPQYARKQTMKRSYSESAPMDDRPVEKSGAEEAQTAPIPEPEDMPSLADDGNKPSYSYAQMIGMAILRAPNRRLTLSQIYDWIATTFSYYRNDPKRGWHNSIRHNLSLNKSFTKMERPKSDSGKGSYWVIEPGQEINFVKDKSRKIQPALTMGPQAIMQTTQSFAQPLAEALAPNPQFSTTYQRPQTAPALPELSSDATLPASDAALDEDDNADFAPLSPPRSSPPQPLNSSPPEVVGEHRRNISSPLRMLRSSSGIKRKRMSTAMDDSGYYSSIESSVLRNNKNKSASVFPSEIDLEPPGKKLKRGRAEEEIARIRSSSHDLTPGHRRFRSLGSPDILSSSPLRQTPLSKMNPATPSVIFKKPIRPPPSISPNSQLNLHRQAMSAFMNSPAKSLGLFGDEHQYSPAFKWPGSASHNAFDDHFEVYSDSGVTPATPGLASSPLKSMKRPSLGRANTSSGALSDVTHMNGRLNPKTPSKLPVLKPTPQIFVGGSPGKMDVMLPAFEHDDLFDFGHFADENSDEGEGLDLTKGFQKIGALQAMKAMSPNKGVRPALGTRSNTSRF